MRDVRHADAGVFREREAEGRPPSSSSTSHATFLSQAYHETVADYDAADVGAGRGRTRVRPPTKKRARAARAPALPAAVDAASASIQAALATAAAVLRAQMTVLETVAGVDVAVAAPATVAAWRAAARAARIGSTDFTAAVAADAAGFQAASTSTAPAATAAAAKSMAASAGVALEAVCGPRALLAAALVGVAAARAPVSPADLVRWALDGSLPYSDVSSYVPDGAPPLNRRLLRPDGAPSPARLAARAAALAVAARITLPPVNAAAFVRRWLLQVGAPLVLAPVAAEVLAVARGGAKTDPPFSDDIRLDPLRPVAAAVVLALKLGYGLGGVPPPPAAAVAALPPPPADWRAWAAAVVAAAPRTLPPPPTAATDDEATVIAYIEAAAAGGFSAPLREGDPVAEVERLAARAGATGRTGSACASRGGRSGGASRPAAEPTTQTTPPAATDTPATTEAAPWRVTRPAVASGSRRALLPPALAAALGAVACVTGYTPGALYESVEALEDGLEEACALCVRGVE